MNLSLALFSLCSMLASPPAAVRRAASQPASSQPSPTKPSSPAVEVLRLRAADVDLERLRGELALRLQRARIVDHASEPQTAAETFFVFVDLRRHGDVASAYTLTIVASDGRAYDRTIAADPDSSRDDVTRLLAGNIANLVSAIEAGTVRADREDVEVPPGEAPPPSCPECPTPVVTPPPVCEAESPAPPRPVPLLELGVVMAPGVVLGLGQPIHTDRFAGIGGELGVALRHRSGALVELDARFVGRPLADVARLLRGRFALAAGYAWRWHDSFELAAAGAFTVEPWSVRASGDRAGFADPSGSRRVQRPLLGGALRLSAGHLFETTRGVKVRVGPRLELGASSAPGDGGRVVELLDQSLRPIGRIGGIELSLGLDVVVWIPSRRR